MSLKLFVNNKDLWDAFLEEMDNNLELTHKQLEQNKDEKELFRFQGEARAYRRLKQLRDKVNG